MEVRKSRKRAPACGRDLSPKMSCPATSAVVCEQLTLVVKKLFGCPPQSQRLAEGQTSPHKEHIDANRRATRMSLS